MSRCFVIGAFALLTLQAFPAIAQPASFQGPIAGFVFSSASKTIRPLFGVPGAAHVDPPILNHVESASIAPGGKWAILTRSGHTSFLRGLSELAPAESSIGGLLDAVDRIAWSRDGSFAVLYSSSASLLQRVALSGGQPVPDTPIDISPWGTVTTIAIDPAGQQIAVGFAGSGLYLFATGQSPALLLSTANPAVAAFDGTGQTLFAVDLDSQRIVQHQFGTGISEFASLTQPDSTLVNPAGLAVSGDGLYLSLADSTTRSVFVYEINSRSLTNTIPLSFAPSRFEALSAGPVFLLNGNDRKEWLLVLDTTQVPAVYFVPANQEGTHD